MSVIANFHKYYKDTDPALDLFDVIVSIYKWFYRNMWERRVQYMKTGKVIPLLPLTFQAKISALCRWRLFSTPALVLEPCIQTKNPLPFLPKDV